jgi:hypothetical protein
LLGSIARGAERRHSGEGRTTWIRGTDEPMRLTISRVLLVSMVVSTCVQADVSVYEMGSAWLYLNGPRGHKHRRSCGMVRSSSTGPNGPTGPPASYEGTEDTRDQAYKSVLKKVTLGGSVATKRVLRCCCGADRA